MKRSVLINLGMLIPVFALAVWIGWPEAQQEPAATAPSTASSDTAALPKSERFKAALHGTTDPRPSPKLTNPSLVQRGIDLNRSSVVELQQLPGVGEVLAQRIVEYRTSHGPFRRIEDLREVKGIGAKRFEQLQSMVTVQKPS